MAKRKEVQPVHLLRMAKHLERVNELAGALIMNVISINAVMDREDGEILRSDIAMIAEQAEALRAAIWPEEE